MKKKMFLIMSLIILSMTMVACGNRTTPISETDSTAETEETEETKISSRLDNVKGVIVQEFNDTHVTESNVTDGSVLYITAGDGEDAEKLGQTLAKLTQNSWFTYDYIVLSQFIGNRLVTTSLIELEDIDTAFHIWYDDNGNLVGDNTTTPVEETEKIEESKKSEDTSTPETKEEKSDAPSVEETNALNKAASYLDFSAFSYTGLIDQLEYEGFSTESATYAADHCGADWNEQAAKKAESYMEFSSFSKQGLIDQLLYEGFTQKQAEYGVKAVGY